MLPTAAVGYGFHTRKERPVINAKIWRHLGHSAGKLVRNYSTESLFERKDQT